MSINRRLEKLEQQAARTTQSGDGPQVVVNLSWEPQAGSMIVDGQSMTQAEFERRWPGWKTDSVVNLGWGDEK